MSDKLFEYKDPQDWYIAQWGEDADYNQFSQVPAEASTPVRSAGTSLCQGS